MKNKNQQDIFEIREMNKISLETFSFDKHNVLDFPIDKLIAEKKEGIKQAYKNHQKWLDLLENEPDKFKNMDEVVQQTGHSLHVQMHDEIVEVSYLEDELFALLEMKIIYSFKHLEINIKKLLTASYNDKSINKHYKWENLIEYLKMKNLDNTKIKGYKEINQLRILNNSLKHAGDFMNDDLNGIPEFKGKSVIQSEDIAKFYIRVENAPIIFLESLGNLIYNNLYEFDKSKIQEIAKSFALRMDKKDAGKLITELLSYYIEEG